MFSLLADVGFPFAPDGPLFLPLVGAGVAILLFLAWILYRAFAGGARVKHPGQHGENLAEYPAPPPVQYCQLLYLNEPVRVRLVIVAPLGRRELPGNLETLLDQAVRGLGQVLAQDKPAWRTWPAQLSWKGFMPTFTRYVQLPTREEEPTPYQLVCGQIRLGGQMVALGMVLLSEEEMHRQTRLLEAHQWVEQCRVQWYG